MTMRITMIQARLGESGSVLAAGTTNTVSDAFGAAMVGAGYATDTDRALMPPVSEYTPATAAAVQALVSGAGTWEYSAASYSKGPLRAVVEDFSTLADWTVTNTANCFITAAAPSPLYPYRGGLRCTSPGTVTESPFCYKEWGGNGTLNGYDFNSTTGWWIVADVRNPKAGGGSINLNLGIFENAFGSGAGYNVTAIGPALSVSVQPRWLPKSQWAVLTTGAWTNRMRSVRLRHDGTTPDARDVVLAGMFVGGKRPTVVVTFDDGWTESYSAGHVEARRRNIPLSHYVIPSLFGVTNYVTAAQVAEMRDAGDYIGLHGLSRWDTDTSLVASDIAACRAAGVDVRHAAIPEGQYGNAAQWQAMRAAFVAGGVKTARITGAAATVAQWNMTLHGIGDPYALAACGGINNTNGSALTEAKASVDMAISSGGTVFFYFHRIGATSDILYWNLGDYEQLLDYIYEKRLAGQLDAVTVDQWYRQAY
jgi:hypothetical protein